MIRCILACHVSLFSLCIGMFGQVAKGQQLHAAPSSAIDSEYRKFEDLLSFLRNRNAQQYAISIFVIQGEEDFTTPTALAEHYLESIKAPRKAFVRISGGGHFAVFVRSDQFLQELVARVRPLAVVH